MGFTGRHLQRDLQFCGVRNSSGQFRRNRVQAKWNVDRSALRPINVSVSRFNWHSSLISNGKSSVEASSIIFPTIFVLNPTSLAKAHAFDQLKCDVEHFVVDIAVICESWLKPVKHSSDLFTLSGFQLFRLDRFRRTGSDICVYVRSQFKCKLYDFGRNRTVNPLFEFLWLHVQSNDSNEMIVCACYHPPRPKYIWL